MTVASVTLTNPGAELGNTTGWTYRSGDSIQVYTSPKHSGAYSIGAANGFSEHCKFDQEITFDAGLHTAIDADTAAVHATAWHTHLSESGYLYVEFYDGSNVLLDTYATDLSAPSSFTQEILYAPIPVNSRKVRIGCYSNTPGFSSGSWWDDFTLETSDDREGDWFEFFAAHAKQLGVYSLGTFPTAQGRLLQAPIVALAAAETSNGFHDAKVHQLGAYALVRGKIDRRDLRAWPFTQDDHDFWVLQLGDVGTLVYDKLTGQWAQWKSAGFDYWRGNDGVQWEGWNICCDSESGKLWIIDPTGRLDEETTSITSVVSGRVTSRMRKNPQCHMAELSVSEEGPPAGVAGADVSIQLRTSDDDGTSYINHGSVTGEDIGEDICVRWYGLGLMPPPGRVFEITDTGYARRIDGFNIEIGNEEVG